MPCSWWDVRCHVVAGTGQVADAAAKEVVRASLDAFARAIQDAIAWMVENTVAWWVKVPSIDPATSGYSTVTEIASYLQGITIAVAVGGMIAAGIRMAVTRRPDPLIGVGRGLAALAAAATLGVVVPSALIRAGDSLSSWVITRAAHDSDIGERLILLMAFGGGVPAGVIIVLGVVALLAAFVQAVLMMFRQGSVLVLTGCLLLAASGQFNEATRPWFRRVTGWMLALICYKPAAALVYAAAFTMAGQGNSPTAMLAGFSMIILSLVALPVLVRLFTWTTGAVTQSGGGGAAAISAAAYGLLAAGSLRQRGEHGSGSAAGSASAQAQFVDQQLGSYPAPGASPPSAPAAPTGAPSTGPANQPATTATSAGAGAAAGAAVGGPAAGAVIHGARAARATAREAASEGQEPQP